MANHLLIGLGGTGGKILREFRKKYFEQFNDFAPHNGNVIEYLYVDSQENDLAMKDWSFMGNDVKLKDSQVFSIHSNPSQQLEDLSSVKLNSFMSRKDVGVLKSQNPDLVSSGIASQRRRLGRILFTSSIPAFRKQVNELQGRLKEKQGDAPINYHICAGLAGGTGSGTLIDVIAQIHSINKGQKVKIWLYLYVPEAVSPDSNNEAFKYYQANAYATLLELNAWRVNRIHPIDLSVGMNADGEIIRSEVPHDQTFQSAYLFSEENEMGKYLNKHTQLPTMVADFLFQKLVESNSLLNNEFAMVDNAENAGFSPVKNKEDEIAWSRNYLSFGIQRIIYPESDIKESIAYDFVKSTLYQMLYNQWDEGYIEVSSEYIRPEWVARATGGDFGLMRLEDKYLTFESPLEDSEITKRWGGNFDNYWNTLAKNIQNDVETKFELDDRLSKFSRAMLKHYDEQFRSTGGMGGVEKYFRQQKSDNILSNTADTLIRDIEKYLFQEWRKGNIGIFEVKNYIGLLMQTLEEREIVYANRKEICEKKEKSLALEMRECAEDFGKKTFLRTLPGNKGRENAFNNYVTKAGQYYAEKTKGNGYEAGIALLKKLVTKLLELQEIVNKTSIGLMTLIDKVKDECAEHALPEIGINDKGVAVFYDMPSVQRIIRYTSKDKTIQDGNAERIRTLITENLGSVTNQTFNAINNEFFSNPKEANARLKNEILKISLQSVENELQNDALNNPKKSITKVNILEKLSEEKGRGANLDDFLKKIKDASARYLSFDEDEIQNTTGLEGRTETQILCLPIWAEDTNDYRSVVIESLGIRKVVDNPNPSELVILSLLAAFPLRFVSNVKALRDAYIKLKQAPDGKYNTLVMHTESFTEEQLPDLFDLPTKEKNKKSEAYLLLAYALGMVKEGEDFETKEPITIFEFKQENGRPSTEKRSEIGILDVLSVLLEIRNGKLLNNLIRTVKLDLDENYLSRTKKEALMSRVESFVDEHILPKCRGGKLGDDYKYHDDVLNLIHDKILAL